jgi:hypothetical protein
MFVRISRTIYLEHNFSKGRVRIWFFGIDWFQIAAIVKLPLVTRLLEEPLLEGEESSATQQSETRWVGGAISKFVKARSKHTARKKAGGSARATRYETG